MSIETEEDLEALKRVGAIVAETIREMRKAVQPGVRTSDLDDLGRQVMERHGARPAPTLLYKFPGATCISVNEQAAHGVPGNYQLKSGDLINIDVSAELDGYFADAGASFPVGDTDRLKQRLCQATKAALREAMDAVQAGQPINRVGRAIELSAKAQKFRVIRELCGHGVGRHLHEEPTNILNYYEPQDRRRFSEGQVLTIEPFLTTAAVGTRLRQAPDGWTLCVPRGHVVAQFEHTLVVTKDKPIVLTA